MKAIVVCRTRNEEQNIARFCRAHQWADTILIADGGSEDRTVEIAGRFPNVVVEHFTERVEQNGHWRNPHGKHMNFMFDWARAHGADWIVFDDCDCVPTVALQRDIRGITETTDKTVILLYRLYVWGDSQYFPEQNDPGQSLWAWRADVPMRALDHDWSHDIVGYPGEHLTLRLEPPLAALHYFCPDEATVERKLRFYRESEQRGGALHPLEGCGPLETLPEWAVWQKGRGIVSKKKTTVKKEVAAKKDWPPKREEFSLEWKWDEGELVKVLAELPGMSQELAQRMARDGGWPASAFELAQKYGMAQMDAEAVLKVLNRNRGSDG